MGLEKIVELKKAMKMTTEELSVRSSVPLGTLNKILSGQTKDPKLGTLIAISKVLNCTLDDFDDTYAEAVSDDNSVVTFDTKEYTKEELKTIRQFAEFLKTQRM